MHKIVIISSHPIQYNAPFFKALSASKLVELHVLYTWSQAKKAVYDPGFGKLREWDIPLLDGYKFKFINNTAKKPGSHHFFGINNPTLIKEIKEVAPDIIIVYGWSFKSHLKVLTHFHGKIQIWFRGDSTLLDETKIFSVKKFLRRKWLKWVFKHVDLALYAGTSNKEYFLAHGVIDERLVHLPHSIENERFSLKEIEDEKNAKKWRLQLAIPDMSLVFLFSGKFETKKDPLLLLEAFSRVRRLNDFLIFVGDGILKDSIKDAAKSLHVEDYVRIVPFQNQSLMPVVYRLGDVFVLPSKGPGETWGLAINEAMACERAVIVSDKCGAARDLVKICENGFIVKHENLDDLIKKMKAIQNADIRTMGRASKEIIDEWSFKNMVLVIEKKLHQSTE